MEIKQLNILRAIAEFGSFSVAAEKLHLTQSALSHQVKNLEDELGESLLIRGKPKVLPTTAGQLVLTSGARIIAEIESLKSHFAAVRRGPLSGTLRVAATSLGMVYHYGDLCQEFIASHPGIELVFRASETPGEAARAVVDGAADVAFIPLIGEHPQLEVIPLGRSEDVVIVGRQHPLFSETTVTVEQLRHTPFVRFLPSSGSRPESDQIFLPAGGYPPIAAESNDIEFVKRIVGMGIATALVPVITVARETRARSLKPLRLRDRTLSLSFGLVYRRGGRTKAIEVLKTFCVQQTGPDGLQLDIENIQKPVADRLNLEGRLGSRPRRRTAG
jgi:DNA-binding transcriptional LysR family regulator